MEFSKVDLQIRWEDLFQNVMSPELRKQRWDDWKALAMADGEQGKQMVDYWAKDHIDETCEGCIHRNNDWCEFAHLPCNVNPILTIQHGMIGMACQGVGYEKVTFEIKTLHDKIKKDR